MLPIGKVFGGYSFIPNDVPHVGVAKDASVRDVGGTGPDRNGLSILKENDEFIMAYSLTHRPGNHGMIFIEPGGFDRRLILDLVVTFRVIHDFHIRAGFDRLGKHVGYGLVVKLIERSPQGHAIASQPNEPHQRLKQPP